MKLEEKGSNSQINYNKYKGVYYDDIKSSIGMLILLLLLSACLVFFMFASEYFLVQIILLLVAIALLLMPISNIIKAVSNLKAQRIIIEKDHLIKTYGAPELGEIINWATFENHKKIALHGPKWQRLIKYPSTPVYIIKAGKTKEILDIVPVNEVE